MLTCCIAENTCIFRVAAVTCVSIIGTVGQVVLNTSASQVVQQDGTSALSIASIWVGNSICIGCISLSQLTPLISYCYWISHHIFEHTESWVSKLSTGYIGIHTRKQVIAHSAPCLIDADLQTSLICQSTTHKPQLTIVTENYIRCRDTRWPSQNISLVYTNL